MENIKLILGMLVAGASLVFLFLLAMFEINFKDLAFAIYFGVFSTLSAVGFFILMRNSDNEETNPEKEKIRR